MTDKNLAKIAAIAAVALAAVLTGGSPMAQQPGFKRVELQRHDLSIPGREVVQVRGEFEPGAAVSPHTHPGDEVTYVLEGTLELHVAGKPTVTINAGEAFMVPAEIVHSAKNTGKVPAKVIAAYLVEKGKPLSTPARDAAK